MKKILYQAMMTVVCLLYVGASWGESTSPIAITASICAEAKNIYSMENGATVSLAQAQKFLYFISQIATLSPHNIVEKIMNMNETGPMQFRCQDQATVNEFTANISFDYTQENEPRTTGNILVRVVPPGEARPTPLTEPKQEGSPFSSAIKNLKIPTEASPPPDTTVPQ